MLEKNYCLNGDFKSSLSGWRRFFASSEAKDIMSVSFPKTDKHIKIVRTRNKRDSASYGMKITVPGNEGYISGVKTDFELDDVCCNGRMFLTFTYKCGKNSSLPSVVVVNKKSKEVLFECEIDEVGTFQTDMQKKFEYAFTVDSGETLFGLYFVFKDGKKSEFLVSDINILFVGETHTHDNKEEIDSLNTIIDKEKMTQTVVLKRDGCDIILYSKKI